MRRSSYWRYARVLIAPILLWGLVMFTLREPISSWLHGEERYDEEGLREWVNETRIYRETLPRMVAGYLERVQAYREKKQEESTEKIELVRQAQLRRLEGQPVTEEQQAAQTWQAEYLLELLSRQESVSRKREEILDHIEAMCVPPTKMYPGQMPFFPIIFRLEVQLELPKSLPAEMTDNIAWDSELPRRPGQYRVLPSYALQPGAQLLLHYQLHAYSAQQRNEASARFRFRWLTVLALSATLLAGWWVFLVQHRERKRDEQELAAQTQIAQAEHLRLEEALRRREAEQKREETEKQLLTQQIATQSAERQALELKSQLYASIGIMAGSYAHNIKNLLVRPNDLLSRCLEAPGVSDEQAHMLHEVRQTLGTVTERLQQILRTVRRDPSKAETNRLDLQELVLETVHTWQELARDKWKLLLRYEPPLASSWLEADRSHLQQALENLLFNARDATFEMRNQLREQARQSAELSPEGRRQAVLAAASWKGEVVFRLRADELGYVLEVQDNGIGMTEEVRQRCSETHFSTKRDNAVYEGINTGMGLGLSFVVAILEHHHAKLEIESQPRQGTTMRIRFPRQKSESTTDPRP